MGYGPVPKRGNMYYYPIYYYYYININIGANIFHHPYGYPDMQVYRFWSRGAYGRMGLHGMGYWHGIWYCRVYTKDMYKLVL